MHINKTIRKRNLLNYLILLFSVECSPGTFYNHESRTCPQCQRGYFQNQSGQDFCIACPGNKTTKSIGSKSVTNCTGKYSICMMCACLYNYRHLLDYRKDVF